MKAHLTAVHLNPLLYDGRRLVITCYFTQEIRLFKSICSKSLYVVDLLI